MPLLSPQNVEDVNTIAAFSADSEQTPLHDSDSAYVLIGSAILHTAKTTLDHLANIPGPLTLVLCGGIGHSTSLLYDSIRKHREYSVLTAEIDGLPEARVFELLLRTFWPELQRRIDGGEVNLLIEDQSTNCGLNAAYTRRLLEKNGVSPKRLIVVQDPTMGKRTIASFNRAWEGVPCDFINWSTFVPRVQTVEETITWSASMGGMGYEGESEQLWGKHRFLELIMGEIPRLRDDASGYGPAGKGFISHVDVPVEVEEAYERLQGVVAVTR